MKSENLLAERVRRVVGSPLERCRDEFEFIGAVIAIVAHVIEASAPWVAPCQQACPGGAARGSWASIKSANTRIFVFVAEPTCKP